MSLSTSIAELKDGLPSNLGASLLRDRNPIGASSEYLNFQFGISPMRSDVRDVIALTKRYEELITQFRRDNNKLVRRQLPLVDTEEKIRNGVVNSIVQAQAGTNGNALIQELYTEQLTFSEIKRERIWFSGAYRIAYPLELDDLLSQIVEFNRVYGVIPTPELAWELLPMSFVVDWFTNVGDVIKNVSTMGPATSLAYGYVMCQSDWTHSQSGMYGPSYYWTRANNPARMKLESSLVWTRKRRLKASPFGFTTDFASLNLKQKSILTALGISRLKL